MIFDRIKFSKEFQTHNSHVWVSIEGPMQLGDNYTDCICQAEGELDKWFSKAYSGQSSVIGSTRVETERGVGNIVADINSCEDVKVLETYKLLVKGNDELQAVYDKKMAELKK